MFAGIMRRTVVLVLACALVGACTQEREVAEKTDDILKDNYELIAMYEQDQQDRSHAEINWAGVGERDAKRRDRVQELLRAHEVRTSEDYRRAAMIFQHGTDEHSALAAHDLAKRSVKLDSTNTASKWLVAASWDRHQMRIGEPQWYGTQFVKDTPNDSWRLYDIDTTQVTDAERQRLGVRTLAEARARVEKLNQQ